MKKKLLLFAVLMSAVVLLTACNDGGDDAGQTDTNDVSQSDVQESDDNGGGTADNTQKAEKVTLNLVQGKKALYRIVYSNDIAEDSRTAITDFAKDFKTKTGVQLSIVADKTAKSSDLKEIVVCETSRSESVDMSGMTYADYGIDTLEDGTIRIWGYGNASVKKAFQKLLNATAKTDDGYSYNGLSKIESSLSSVLAALPKAETGGVSGVYESADGVYQVTLGSMNKSGFTAYCSKLAANGFTLHSENTIDSNNTFATYKNDKYAVHVGYHGKASTVEVIIEKLGYLPSATAPTYTKKVEASITQVTVTQGMLYVIQLEDGSFIIIDGGVSDGNVMTELMTVLNTKNSGTGYSKPQVTWMFTHAHPDHIALAADFLAKYYNDIELNLVCANFIDLERDYGSVIGDGYSHATLMKTVKTKYPKAQIMNYHTGQSLKLAGCEISFYLTHEDVYPITMGTLNTASTSWKMNFGGKTFMILGDSTETCAEILNQYYGTTLKSDVMQAAHHGVNSGSSTAPLLKQLYKNIDPKHVMWSNKNPANVTAFAGNSEILKKAGLVSYYGDETRTLLIKNI